MGGRGSRGEGAHLRTCRFFGRTRYTRLCRSHGRGACRPKTIPSPEVNAYTSASLAGMARGQCKCRVPRPLKPPIVRIYLITEQFLFPASPPPAIHTQPPQFILRWAVLEMRPEGSGWRKSAEGFRKLTCIGPKLMLMGLSRRAGVCVLEYPTLGPRLG